MESLFKKLTSHGSISIPVALRRELGLEGKDPVELELTKERNILIKPYLPRCCFCGSQEDIKQYKGRGICPDCVKAVYEALNT